jgi:hypothetical protein
MATEHGYDIGGWLDISPELHVVHGLEALTHALARRLTTVRGTLWYALAYGHDVRQYVNAPTQPPGVIESQVSAECLKDERVRDVDVDVSGTGEELRIRVKGFSLLGPFTLTLKVTPLTVDILREAA